MSQDVLSQKQKFHFAQSEAAFTAWAEDHAPDEIELAIAEINGYVADQDRQIDEQIAYSRDTVRQQADKKKRHLQAQLSFVHWHPEFRMTQEAADVLMDRVYQILRSQGVQENEMEASLELLELAWQQLVSEHRAENWIDDSKGSPWARTISKAEMNQPDPDSEPLTEAEIEEKLDKGLITLEDVAELAGGVTQDGVTQQRYVQGDSFRGPDGAGAAAQANESIYLGLGVGR